MMTEAPIMIEAVEILSQLPGTIGRKVVEVQLPLRTVEQAVCGRGWLELVDDLYGRQAVTIREVSLDEVDELVCALGAADRVRAHAMVS